MFKSFSLFYFFAVTVVVFIVRFCLYLFFILICFLGFLTLQASQNSLWTLDCETEISYGDTERQKMDIFHKKNASKKGAPIFVYFHGGYWQEKAVKREICSFMAVPLCEAGVTVIPVGYDLCPDVSMGEILAQVKKAMQVIIQLGKERQSRGIYIGGHSAGAHLSAILLSTVFDDDAFDSELIKGGVLISGVFDLVPLTKTSVNKPLQLSEQEAQKYSPLYFISEMAQICLNRHILVAVAEYDPPEYRRQSGEMEKKLRDCGVKTTFLDIEETDHFNLVEKMSMTNYRLTKECLRLMGM